MVPGKLYSITLPDLKVIYIIADNLRYAVMWCLSRGFEPRAVIAMGEVANLEVPESPADEMGELDGDAEEEAGEEEPLSPEAEELLDAMMGPAIDKRHLH